MTKQPLPTPQSAPAKPASAPLADRARTPRGVAPVTVKPRVMARLCAAFAWRTVKDTGVYRYQQNEVTGERRWIPGIWFGRGHQPLAQVWLDGGCFDARPPALRVMAMARPARISAPVKSDVAALSKPETFDRWKAGVKAATQPGEATITIYDVIGEDPWSGGGVTLNRVDAALRRIGNNAVEVHINSPGGDMFEGIGIYNRLLEHPAKVTVKVMGLAASAASIIAMAGDEVQIGPASFLMIHNCWVVAIGDRNDMQATADFLAPFDAAMSGVYAARTGLKDSEIAAMLDAETWLNGQQAVDKGFADSLLNADDMQEDEAATAEAASTNALRQAEIQLCRSGSTRSAARSLLNKIKGTPGAASETPTPGAGDHDWGDLSPFSNIFQRP